MRIKISDTRHAKWWGYHTINIYDTRTGREIDCCTFGWESARTKATDALSALLRYLDEGE